MTQVRCTVRYCKFNGDGECQKNYIAVHDVGWTSDGPVPACDYYEEKEDNDLSENT